MSEVDVMDDRVTFLSPVLALEELSINRVQDRSSDTIFSGSTVEDTNSHSVPYVSTSDNVSTVTYPLSATDYATPQGLRLPFVRFHF